VEKRGSIYTDPLKLGGAGKNPGGLGERKGEKYCCSRGGGRGRGVSINSRKEKEIGREERGAKTLKRNW